MIRFVGASFWLGLVLTLIFGSIGLLLLGLPLSLPHLVLMLVLGALWHSIGRAFAGTPVLSTVTLVSPEAKASEELDSLLADTALQFRDQYEQIRSEMGRVQTLLTDAVTTLTSSFNGMHDQTQEQRRLTLAATMGEGNGTDDVGFDEFVANTSSVMGKVVDSIIANSKLGMELVELTDGIARRTQDVQSNLSEISGIAKQTNLLALNAAIEAARAGEAGRGFAVVADEVRDLSARTSQFSQQISSLMQGMQSSVKQTEAAIQRMAGQDMTFALESKGRVEEIIRAMENQGKERLNAINGLSASAAVVDAEVSRAITALQFQDLVSQLLGHVRNRIDAIDGATLQLGEVGKLLRDHAASQDVDLALSSLKAAVKSMRDELAALEPSTSNNPVSQHSMSHGDVELF